MANIRELNVNGTVRRINVDSERNLLSVLRDEMDLTGSKYGCGEGQCGACTVLIDKTPTRSCITKVGAVAGKPVTTIEGLENKAGLHPLQQAFLEADAFQCGFCTSGMIMSGVALLDKNRNPGEADIIRSMEGNICRCGAYPRIVVAIKSAAQRLRGGAK
jgi:aerobic-type carbon monoxide dehydrogenase small subunit (CoxS/CutS family)